MAQKLVGSMKCYERLPVRPKTVLCVYVEKGLTHTHTHTHGFLWHTLLNRCRPDLGALKTMCQRLRKR